MLPPRFTTKMVAGTLREVKKHWDVGFSLGGWERWSLITSILAIMINHQSSSPPPPLPNWNVSCIGPSRGWHIKAHHKLCNPGNCPHIAFLLLENGGHVQFFLSWAWKPRETRPGRTQLSYVGCSPSTPNHGDESLRKDFWSHASKSLKPDPFGWLNGIAWK